MVRRRLLSSSAKQASMSAYQKFWQQQQQQAQAPLVLSTPQYWHSVCPQLGGANPSRRHLMKQQPRETEQQQQQVPLQREYQSMWGRCCGNTGALLKPGAIMPAFPHLGYRQVTARAVPSVQPQRSFPYQQGNFLSYPAAVQVHQMAWQQQQQQQQPQQHPHVAAPVGILKKASQHESAGAHTAKRVTIKAPARFQAPSVEQVKPVKPRPEVPRRPTKRMRQHFLRREQQKVLQQQILQQKQWQTQQKEQKELQKLQKKLHKKQEQQKALQMNHHRLELERVQQQMQQYRQKQQHLHESDEKHRRAGKLLERSNYFNIGKIASNFLYNSDSETSLSQEPQNPNRTHNFSYQETKTSSDRKPEVPRKRVKEKSHSSRLKDPLDLGNESSTITLTTEQSQADGEPPKDLYGSGTNLVDKATNTQIDPLNDLLRQVPLRVPSATGRGPKKLNISELLRSEPAKGLDADPLCQSLRQLVAFMCESREKLADPERQSRLRAGSGGDDGNLRKQYSVYLMVTSEDEDEGELLSRSNGNRFRITGGERFQGEDEDDDEFSQHCADAYQDECPRLGRRKRLRKRLSSRLDDLDYLSSGPLPFLPMRRPLHWPKPDYSKLNPGRASPSRTPPRVRSRSSSKQVIPMRSQRSVCSVLDPKRSWKLWEDLPMTARTLNKAYSRLWTKSGGQSCTKF